MIYTIEVEGGLWNVITIAEEEFEAARADFFKVLNKNPNEVSGLRDALIAGEIDGVYYEGDCACLIGIIAKIKKVYYPDLMPDSRRPAERWLLAIKEGNTPENNQVSEITVSWIDQWLKGRNV
jgi:hypothetical protein